MLVVDARADPVGDLPRLVAGLADLIVPYGAPRPGAVLVDAARHELRFERCPQDLFAIPAACRGIDLVVVLVGRATADAAVALRIAGACGVRRAVAVVPSPAAGGRDLSENHARHLLLDTGFDADDVPTVALHADIADLTADERARIIAAVDAAVVPRPPGPFVVVDNIVVAGALPPGRSEGFRLEGAAFVPDALDLVDGCRAGEHITQRDGPAHVVLFASEPLPLVGRLGPVDRAIEVDGLSVGASPLLFGGHGGLCDGVVERPRGRAHPARALVRAKSWLAPVDGKIGVIHLSAGNLWCVDALLVP